MLYFEPEYKRIMTGIPTFEAVARLFHEEEYCLEYLIGLGALKVPTLCSHCGNDKMAKVTGPSARDNYYRCCSAACRKGRSLKDNSFFSKTKLKCKDVLFLAYLWLCQCKLSTIVHMTGHAKRTVSDWCFYFRQAVEWDLNHLDVEYSMIGGPGITVEVDESKFAKRKYNVGHAVIAPWVVGGVERSAARGMFAVTVNDRKASTLKNILERFIHPGSLVNTDLWKGYKPADMAHLGFTHNTVNHSQNFVDPVTATHINTIEGTWAAMKM